MVLEYMASIAPPTPAKKELMQKESCLWRARLMPMALGGHLVVADGLEGAAIAGVDQQYHDGDAHAGDDEGDKRGEVQRLPVGERDIEVVEGRVVP